MWVNRAISQIEKKRREPFGPRKKNKMWCERGSRRKIHFPSGAVWGKLHPAAKDGVCVLSEYGAEEPTRIADRKTFR